MTSKKINYELRNYAIDKLFTSDKKLGYIYTKKYTTFNIWAPIATKVELIEYINENKILHELKRQEDGVFSITLKGNKENMEYNYIITHDDSSVETIDPYAVAANANAKRAVVVDLNKTNPKDFNRMPAFTNPVDAVIYELCIRDFKLKYKGKFLALTEKKAINYFKKLGITHIQLLPIYDFSEESVDELNPYDKYNWGYDPVNYNVVEGSYSTCPNNPTTRIKELKKAIKTLHDNGIRVIMDVVYNHVYDAMAHSLEKTCPSYAFRKDNDLNFSNGTYCGNDIASERAMIRKYIVDSIVYWAKEYRLDGFRFDLMGILDVDTMNLIRQKLDEIDKSIIILGEAWHLNTELEDYKKANQTNAHKLNNIACFNDDIRDSIKGSHFESSCGFVNSWNKKDDRLINSIKGGMGLYSYKYPSQVVQYVEAHDNYTLFDYLNITNKKDNIYKIKKMHKMASSIILTSQGISFIHAGQEFFRTKQMVENSYKSSDEINKFDWDLMKENKNSVKYISDLIKLRKEEKLFRLTSYEEIEKNFKLLNYNKSFLAYELGEKYIILANSSAHSKSFKLNGTYQVIASKYKFLEEKLIVKDKINVSSLNFIILKKEKKL